MNDKITIVFGEEDNLEISFKEQRYDIESEETIRFNVGGVELQLDSKTGVLRLLDNVGKVLSEVDFPTEKIITNAYYDYDTQELVLEFENAQPVRVPIKTDFSNYYTIEQVNNLLNSLKLKLNDIIQSNINSLDKKITDLENKKANRNELFSGSYNDLSDKPKIPTKVSELEQDVGVGFDEEKVIEIVGKETLKLEDKINELDENVYASLEALSNGKVDKVDGYGLSKNDLTDELLSKLNSLENYNDTNIKKQIDEIKQVLSSDDVDYDTLQELVNALKNNVSSIGDIFTELSKKANSKDVFTKEETTELISYKEDKENLIIKTEIGTSKDLGGIKAGTVLKGQTVLSVLEQLLFPYIAFTMNVQSISPSGTYEKGTSVTITSVTVKITSGTKPVTNIKLYESNKTTLLGEKTSGISTNNTFSINKTVTSAVSFYATATDGTSNVSDSSSFLAFYDPTFYGVLDTGYSLKSGLITGKTKILKANKNNTFTYTATNQHPFVAFPASYGNLTSIKDSSNLEYIGDFVKTTMNLNVTGGTVSYNIYVLKDPTDISNYKFIFS